MSDRILTAEEKAAERRRGPRTRAMGPHNMAGTGEKSLNFWPSAKRLIGRLRPERRLVFAGIALTLVAVVFNTLGPKILGRATDYIFAGLIGSRLPAGMSKADAVAALRARGETRFADMVAAMDVVPGQGIDFAAVSRVLWLVLALYAGAALLQWAQGWVIAGVVQRSMYRLRQDVETKLNRLPLPYFDNQPRGELLSRVTNDIDNVGQSLQQTLSQLLNALITLVAVLAMMFWISWVLALIALVTVPLAMVVTGFIAKRSQRLFVRQWASTGELNGIIEETYTGHALVKVFGRQRQVEERFAVTNASLYEAASGAQFISGIMMPLMFFIGNLNYVLVAVVGGLRVSSGAMSLGDVQAFIQYSRQFTQPLTQVASMANLLQSGVASAERVFEVLDAAEAVPEAPRPLVVDNPNGEVRFEDVSFSYASDKPLIEHLDLVVAPGQTVAIVGPTGAGKTTLVNLVMRFYELDGGRITLDGVDIAAMTRHDLRSRIGMVLQDTWLFHGTIGDNIAYGKPGATRAEVIAAAKATFVDRFVHSLPDGYDTVLDDEASNISAGEKQLITIARAFLSEPDLLILDEATSSVDTRTEALLQHGMRALRGDRTSFVIAHRLSTIRDADTILVMEEGRIVEQGSHEDLIAAAGAYARLYEAQFAGPDVEVDGDGTPPRPPGPPSPFGRGPGAGHGAGHARREPPATS